MTHHRLLYIFMGLAIIIVADIAWIVSNHIRVNQQQQTPVINKTERVSESSFGPCSLDKLEGIARPTATEESMRMLAEQAGAQLVSYDPKYRIVRLSIANEPTWETYQAIQTQLQQSDLFEWVSMECRSVPF